jgi:hypothetical protein
MAASGLLRPPNQNAIFYLGNRCSIHLSYGSKPAHQNSNRGGFYKFSGVVDKPAFMRN